ncbi:F-box protein AFR-like [Hibiscus syriacus]|uniref:F-box protein AFR-like n=1 Tax=Hibiscus syriacus TaxID=106335 RepID=UPI0019243C01|nr:F-box protein AFR-like [Hibiscus syriacus]
MGYKNHTEKYGEKGIEGKQEALIPRLPDEIAELCLLHLPYPYQLLARSVCCFWNKIITGPSFLVCKRSLLLSLPYLFIFAFHKSMTRIQWQAMDLRSNCWFVLPSMPCPKAVCPPGFANTRQGQLYVLGASPMVTPRSFFAAGNVNGKIIAVDGSGGEYNDSKTSVECYDPHTDTWEQVPKMHVEMCSIYGHYFSCLLREN